MQRDECCLGLSIYLGTFKGFMKIIILILYLFPAAMTGLSMAALAPAGGTNESATINRPNRSEAKWRDLYYRNGRLDRLEQEVNRLENGFTVVAVLIGSTFASLCVLAARDRIRGLKSITTAALGEPPMNRSQGPIHSVRS